MAKQKKEKAEEVKESNVFSCCGKEFEFTEFKTHLKEVHQIDKENMKGKKQMVMHMDGDKWFSSTYDWTLEGGLKFRQFITLPRKKSQIYW